MKKYKKIKSYALVINKNLGKQGGKRNNSLKFNKGGFLKNNTNFKKNFSYKKRQTKSSIRVALKTFRIFEALIDRRNKIVKRLINLNTNSYNNIISRYNSFRWLKDYKLIWGLRKYKREIESQESQGLKRKVVKRKLKVYAIALLDKQKIKSYYIGLKEFYLKNIVSEVFIKRVNALNVFVMLLESRISSFLFRSNLFKSGSQIKIFLKLGYIKVNNVVMKNSNYFLNSGDKVSLAYFPKNKNVFFNNLKKKFSLFYYPTKYMEISFPLMVFLYYKSPQVSDIVYPFNVNLSRILYYYNYKGLR
jgi:ribosomal protein S4